MDGESALRQAADLLSRSTMLLLIVGSEFAEDCDMLLAQKDLSSLGVPGMTLDDVYNPDKIHRGDSTLFYGNCAVVIP